MLSRIIYYVQNLKNENERIKPIIFIKGVFRRIYYKHLRTKFLFDVWHISPLELRPYASKIVEWGNSKKFNCVVEVGCGLGEIIRNIHAAHTYGFDIDANVIQAANYLNKEKRCVFNKGSFNEAGKIKEHKINCLIAVNFIHAISYLELKNILNTFIDKNEVDYIIVDEVRENCYKYNHDFSQIMPKSYALEKQYGPYKAQRYIKIYRKQIL